MNSLKPTVTLEEDRIYHKDIIGEENYNKTINCTFFLLVLFTKGSGTHFIDNVGYPIGDKQLHLLFPGQHHHWITGPETVAQKIVIGRKAFETFSSMHEFYFIRYNLHPVIKLRDSIFDVIHNEMSCIKRELSSGEGHWLEVIGLRIDILTSVIKPEIGDFLKNSLRDTSNETLDSFWTLVNINYIKHKHVRWYAEKLNVTSNYLNILCRKHLNITASSVIQQKTAQEAKQLLRHTSRSVKEIAFQLGFESISAFSTFFKNMSGYSPSEYKG